MTVHHHGNSVMFFLFKVTMQLLSAPYIFFVCVCVCARSVECLLGDSDCENPVADKRAPGSERAAERRLAPHMQVYIHIHTRCTYIQVYTN